MASSKGRGLAAIGASLGLAAALAGCASNAHRVDAFTPAPVGSVYSFAQKNTGSYGQDVEYTLTRVEDGSYQGRPALMLRSSRGPTTVFVMPSAKLAAMLAPDGKAATTWDPPIGWEYPLAVGRRWNQPSRLTSHANNRTLSFEWSCAVEDYADTVVPAGTFKTYRIECKNTIGTQETYWFSPAIGHSIRISVKRDASSPLGVGTQDTVLVGYRPGK